MAKKDYYEILGVSAQASLEEIKRSFRTKARALHPDNKHSGDEIAFKELAEAYDVLSDEQRREIYNRYGHEGLKGRANSFDNFDFSSFAGFGMDDLLDAFFGGGLRSTFRQGGPEPGSHLQLELQIEFLEAVFGDEKTIPIKRLQECELCSGSGASPGSKAVTCSTCNGIGKVQQVINSWFGQSIRVSECPSCQGSGKRLEKPCRVCRGLGLEKKESEVTVRIPAGIENGSRLRITGGGDKGKHGGGFGDLYIMVRVREHEHFIRDGDNIFIKQTISFSQAALGGQLLVPTVDGMKTLTIHPGTQTGAMLVMKNLGAPRLSSPNRRGDQLVQLTVTTPTKLSAQEKKLFEQLAQLRPEKNISADDQQQSNAAANKLPNTESSKSDDTLIDKIVGAFAPRHEDAI